MAEEIEANLNDLTIDNNEQEGVVGVKLYIGGLGPDTKEGMYARTSELRRSSYALQSNNSCLHGPYIVQCAFLIRDWICYIGFSVMEHDKRPVLSHRLSLLSIFQKLWLPTLASMGKSFPR